MALTVPVPACLSSVHTHGWVIITSPTSLCQTRLDFSPSHQYWMFSGDPACPKQALSSPTHPKHLSEYWGVQIYSWSGSTVAESSSAWLGHRISSTSKPKSQKNCQMLWQVIVETSILVTASDSTTVLFEIVCKLWVLWSKCLDGYLQIYGHGKTRWSGKSQNEPELERTMAACSGVSPWQINGPWTELRFGFVCAQISIMGTSVLMLPVVNTKQTSTLLLLTLHGLGVPLHQPSDTLPAF